MTTLSLTAALQSGDFVAEDAGRFPAKLPETGLAPPGLSIGAPPGLERGLFDADVMEVHKLQAERARLMNDRFELETQRLAHENVMLRLRWQQAQLMAGMSSPMARGPPPGAWTGAAQARPRCFSEVPPDAWGGPTGADYFALKRPREHLDSMDSTVSTNTGSDFKDISGSEVTDAGGDAEKTTVMMRNLPNDYSRDELLALLDKEGFQGLYDLVYLPIDFSSASGLGYSFVNLVSLEFAKRFRTHFHQFDNWGVCSEKCCDVSGSATHQGLQANIERYRNSPVMHEAVPDEYRPVIFSRGVRVAFPAPTRRPKAPAVRRRSASSDESTGNH